MRDSRAGSCKRGSAGGRWGTSAFRDEAPSASPRCPNLGASESRLSSPLSGSGSASATSGARARGAKVTRRSARRGFCGSGNCAVFLARLAFASFRSEMRLDMRPHPMLACPLAKFLPFQASAAKINISEKRNKMNAKGIAPPPSAFAQAGYTFEQSRFRLALVRSALAGAVRIGCLLQPRWTVRPRRSGLL